MAKATIVTLGEPVKQLLALMHFEAVPKEAKYLAFFEDGQAQFFEEIDFSAERFTLRPIPKFVFVGYYPDVELIEPEAQ